jgi:4-hydroxybenzoate polyprenyltransferase
MNHAVRAIGRLWDRLVAVDRFVRLHQLFFTAIWPLLGAASVRPDLAAAQLMALLGVTLCFLISAAVFNDVIDLPIDRTDPHRQHDPLVRGIIRPRQALIVALVQPLLTIPFTIWLGGNTRAHLMLAVAFILMAAYNAWGKRCPFPPLTDAIQGLSWASLTLYAPLALAMAPNALTWTLAAYGIVLTLFFNGIHGSLRDLTNDFSRGARTTAILLGARPSAGNGPARVPGLMAAYAWLVLALLVLVSAVLMFRNDFGYGPIASTVTTLAVGSLHLAAIVLHADVVRPRASEWDWAWRLQLYLVTVNPIVAFAAHAGIEVTATLFILHVLALVLFGCTGAVSQWIWVWILSGLSPVRIVRSR